MYFFNYMYFNITNKTSAQGGNTLNYNKKGTQLVHQVSISGTNVKQRFDWPV